MRRGERALLDKLIVRRGAESLEAATTGNRVCPSKLDAVARAGDALASALDAVRDGTVAADTPSMAAAAVCWLLAGKLNTVRRGASLAV